MNSRMGAVAALIVAIGLAVWFRLHPSEEPKASKAETTAEEALGDPKAVARPESAPTPPHAPALPPIDRAKRDAMRELIYKAFNQPPPAFTPPSKATYVLPEHGPGWTGTEIPGQTGSAEVGIEPEYIQDSVRQQFFPVANKCYADALATNPKLGGQIDLWFVIVGDKNIGGIVESVDVLNKSTLRDPDVIECLRESFLGVTFPPPKGGGAVTVEYPIIFSNDDDGGG
jgi:hypothetical protein